MQEPRYQIAGWRFDPSEPVLRGAAGERHLEDRAARTLALLCSRRGRIVSKADLIAEVWNGRSVSPNSVSIVIGSLRRALDDDPDDPTFITTVARRGYRLSTEGADTAPDPDPMPERASLPASPAHPLGWLLILLLLGMTCLGLHSILATAKLPLAVQAPRNDTGQSSMDGLAAALAPVVSHGVGRLRDVEIVDDSSAARARVVVRSRLILWNGAPELALDAVDRRTHALVWSGFAAGPPALLARHVEDRIATLAQRLPTGRAVF